jgi:hypothetical protein
MDASRQEQGGKKYIGERGIRKLPMRMTGAVSADVSRLNRALTLK